ncbi:MAG: tRNA (adenosine(37)-N6)-threonylcarbamoyltransferase complex ATPase subunit type 1 TsaE [Rickettsiaceae bacterium]
MSTIEEVFTVNTEEESKLLAIKLANNLKPNSIIALRGDLGSGKSFLCRHIIHTLCGDEVNVTSPTFNLLQIYDRSECQIYHYDLYRLKSIDEIYELGIEEAFNDNICLIEWPELIKSILPPDTIYLDIKIINHTSRAIKIQNAYSLSY